jgi:hypothetical protein
VIVTMRVVIDIDDRDNVAFIDEGRIWEIGSDNILEY